MSGSYEEVKRWRAANPDKVRAQGVRYRARKRPELQAAAAKRCRQKKMEKLGAATVRAAEALAVRQRRAKNPNAARCRAAAFKVRFRQKQDQLMGRPRPETCEVCHEKGYGRICFDHDHATGLPRGWLCDRCNKVLGLVKDDVALLVNLAIYLEASRGKVNRENPQCDSWQGVRFAEQALSH